MATAGGPGSEPGLRQKSTTKSLYQEWLAANKAKKEKRSVEVKNMPNTGSMEAGDEAKEDTRKKPENKSKRKSGEESKRKSDGKSRRKSDGENKRKSDSENKQQTGGESKQESGSGTSKANENFEDIPEHKTQKWQTIWRKMSMTTQRSNKIAALLDSIYDAKGSKHRAATVPRSDTKQRERKFSHRPDEVFLPIQQIKLPFFILYVYYIEPLWEWFMALLIFSQFLMITYLAVFSLYLKLLHDIFTVLDNIFLIDSLSRIAIEVWRHWTKTPCLVLIVRYTLAQFVVDWLSSVPLEWIYLWCIDIDNMDQIKQYDYLRFNRILRFYRIFRFFDVAVKERRISDVLMFFVDYLTKYLSFIQGVACLFFIMLPCDPLDFLLKNKLDLLESTWMNKLSTKKPGYLSDPWDHYVLTMSFSTAVVTTTGYGDISALSTGEMILASFVMLTGAILLSGMYSSGLTAFKLEHDGARFDLFFRVGAIIRHLDHINSADLFQNKVLEYYSLLWNYREGVFEVRFIDELPKSMIEDMFYDICQEMTYKTSLFRNLDETFLRALAGIVQVVLYNPDMILCSAQSYAMNMFYLLQGEVRVKSKFDPDFTAVILRAGCLIGEFNLFFSFPYTTTMETRTCCQMLLIRKYQLFELFKLFPKTLEVIRRRVSRRLEELQNAYELNGSEPVCWISHRTDISPEAAARKSDVSVAVVMRRGTGFNKIITDDVIDDTKETIIVDMPCLNKKFSKQHMTVYKTCVIPSILTPEQDWVNIWCMFILFVAIYNAIMGPYCLTFRLNSEFKPMEYVCYIDSHMDPVLFILFAFDVFVEITQSVPVSGLYYKLKDGFQVKATEITFWVDVFCVLPFNVFGWGTSTSLLKLLTVMPRCLKIWKVFRYFRYLDNINPDSLFLYRLLQTVFFLVFANHFLTCLLYSLACEYLPDSDKVTCQANSWLRSFDDGTGTHRLSILAQTKGYLISFYFACATITSAGFGDFSAQTRNEMLFLIFFQLLSFCVIGYYTALLTSALSCTVRPKLVFQQKLIGIKQFMHHKGLAEALQGRVIEHYYLQDQLWHGVNLPTDVNHLMYDTPEYLEEDALYLEVELHFDGIPIFTKLDPKSMVDITKLMRRYLIPPHSTFLRKGEVRRQMYVIAKGSVGFMIDGKPVKILTETGHFGLRDLLFGEPAHHDIQTLSYCLLLEVELRDLMEALAKDTELLEVVEEEKLKLQKGIDAMIKEYSLHSKVVRKEKSQRIPSFIEFPKSSREDNPSCSYEEYTEVFDALTYPTFFRAFLMRRAVHPAGDFAKIWISFMSLISGLTVISLVCENFMGLRTFGYRIFQYTLDWCNWTDIYIKLHWGYYGRNNMLISHPVQTSINYVFSGGFVADVIFSIPFEYVVFALKGGSLMGYDNTAYWFSKFRCSRIGQIFRFPAVFKIFHNIFQMRSLLLLILYNTMTLMLGTAVSALALNLACPTGHAILLEGDENKLPFCSRESWVAKKSGNALHGMWTRWIYGLYYVTQVMFVIGFGDMTTLASSEITLLIFLMLFGFIIMRCIVADMTAAEVDIDEVRHKYLEEMKCLFLVMAREKVHPKTVRNVKRHLHHAWEMSEGLQPRQLFADLHPALEADMFRDLVGEELAKVPVFKGFRENIQRTICQYMNTLFFRRGERIVHYGNTDVNMFIIVQGRVWIANRFLRWTHTLVVGESFGEASILFGTRREYNAVAANDVELFVLSADDFAAVLERYPAVEDELKSKLGNQAKDMFQQRRIKKKMRPKSYLEEKNRISNEIKDLLYANENPDPDEEQIFIHKKEGAFRAYIRRFFGYGNDDQNLPFLYLARSRSCRMPFLIHPKCSFHTAFSYLVILICYLTPCIGVYEICFYEEELRRTAPANTIGTIATFMEIPFYLHIFFQFITPFLNNDGQYCKEFSKIAFNYATTPTRFPVDIISAFPVIRKQTPQPSTWNDFWKYIHVVRFLRLLHYYRSQFIKKGDLSTSTFRYKITLSISTLMLLAHGLACLFYGLSPCRCPTDGCKSHPKLMCVETTWTHQFVNDNNIVNIDDMIPSQWYIRSLYWVITTVSTTGFGDITPLNTTETILAVVSIFCGAFVLSIILSHFTSGTASISKSAREYLYQVNLLVKHMGNIGMSQEKRDQVMSYFVMRWEKSRGVRYHESTQILPSTLRAEVCYALYFTVVNKCPLFTRNLDTSFLRQLCLLFQHSMYIAGINVVNEGYLEKEEREEGAAEVAAGSMYLVFKGRISGYRYDDLGNPLLVKTYDVGKLFGRHAALFYEQAYNKTYRAETYSEVLKLSQRHLLYLMNQFPAFAENVLTMIIQKYDTTEEAECIFEKKKIKKDSYEGAAKMEEGEYRPDASTSEVEHKIIPGVNPVVAQIALADLEMRRTKANLAHHQKQKKKE